MDVTMAADAALKRGEYDFLLKHTRKEFVALLTIISAMPLGDSLSLYDWVSASRCAPVAACTSCAGCNGGQSSPPYNGPSNMPPGDQNGGQTPSPGPNPTDMTPSNPAIINGDTPPTQSWRSSVVRYVCAQDWRSTQKDLANMIALANQIGEPAYVVVLTAILRGAQYAEKKCGDLDQLNANSWVRADNRIAEMRARSVDMPTSAFSLALGLTSLGRFNDEFPDIGLSKAGDLDSDGNVAGWDSGDLDPIAAHISGGQPSKPKPQQSGGGGGGAQNGGGHTPASHEPQNEGDDPSLVSDPDHYDYDPTNPAYDPAYDRTMPEYAQAISNPDSPRYNPADDAYDPSYDRLQPDYIPTGAEIDNPAYPEDDPNADPQYGDSEVDYSGQDMAAVAEDIANEALGEIANQVAAAAGQLYTDWQAA